MFIMMKTHQLLFVLLGFLSAHLHVDAYVLDEDSGLEELFTMCMNGSCESESFSCTNRCGSSLPNSRSCQCDHECLILGDCCLDYEHLCIPLAIRHHTRMVASSLPVPDTSLSSSVSQEDEGNRAASSIGDNFLIPPSVIVANYPDFDLSLRRSHMHLGDRACVKASTVDLTGFRQITTKEMC
ncbi:uncharacterized protein LOC115929094 [Strongylocentrotus purpuratus]|uniref:SMB domain-containing protein n=1 Tax=Strongylocentrotus purpuratus TaxID=7668 RepID=A0A7M7PKQ2_STRPU|nr:uncharacterized protein LOC115929094 [Strongylocentrotus purpuratus]